MTDESRALLSTKISARANKLVREIVSSFPLIAPRGWDDIDITKLRLMVGMAARELSMIGAQYGSRRVAPKPAGATQTPRVPPAPPRTSDTPLDLDEVTTAPMRRHPDHADLGDE